MTNKSLLPVNATNLEKDVEGVVSRIDDIPVPIKDLWNPESCPAQLLPWLAWAVSVDVWESSWPENIKRKVIANSLAIHRIKGTVKSVEQALDALGVKVEISEWFEHDGQPHTFYLTALVNSNLSDKKETILGPKLYRTLRKSIDQVKPVRSHYDFRVGAAMESNTGVACGASVIVSKQLRCEFVCDPGLRVADVAIGAGIIGRSYLRVTMESE